jgi:hypothetical protein
MKALALAVLVASTAAPAASQRIAVVVGANRGALGRPDLRYSYRDAQNVADTLIEVGEFKPADVHVLRDPSPATVLGELDRELAALRADHGESLLVFYYSGHADGAALYPAGQPLLYSDLRARLESSAATVRLGIIDACSGGGWTGAKGLHAAPPFAVQVPLELSGEGSVLIASSSGLEKAHESEGLLGSYFTHHLVAGLRGAADPRGDGIVTVSDAFAYAKERTVRDTAAVATEPQHPSFFMNLRGRADLPVARVQASPTLVELQEMEGPLQLIHLGTGVVVLEVPPGRRELKLSVPAGRYLLRRESDQGNRVHEITVEPGRSIQVREEQLQLIGVAARGGKGTAEGGVEAWPLSLEERPLTLGAGVIQFDVGLLFGVYDRTGENSGTTSLAPSFRYGLADRVTISLGSSAICLGSSWCARYGSGATADLAVAVLSAGPTDFAIDFGPGLDSFGLSMQLHGGFTGRVRAGPLALLVAPQFRYTETTALHRAWTYAVATQVLLQITERFALDAVALMQAPLDSPNPFRRDPANIAAGTVPLTLGASVALGRHWDGRVHFTFENVVPDRFFGPGDRWTVAFFASLRP